MTKIAKMNFVGAAFTALALTTSVSMVGCAAPAGSQNPPVGSIQGPQYAPPTSGSVSQIPSSHQAGVFGTLRGTIVVLDNEGRSVSQPHTISISPNGGAGVILSFASGNQYFQSHAAIHSNPRAYGGVTYILTSSAQNNPSIYPNAPVILQVQVSVDAAGNYDSYNTTAGMYESYQFRSVVKFNSALSR